MSEDPAKPFLEVAARITGRRIEELDQAQDEPAKLVSEVVSPAQHEPELGFFARLLVQATLPHSDPGPGVSEFQRTNGVVTVKIRADSDYGMPFGHYPRLLLAWVTTEAVRTKSPLLELGDSLSAFMSKLDLVPRGGSRGTIRFLRSHMQRLFSSTVSATYQSKQGWVRIGFNPVEEAVIFWDPRQPGQSTLWRSTIRLNQRFYDEIVERPVPIDLGALRELSKTRSSLAIDVYMWLTHRLSYLSEPTTISWQSLALQFGGDYGRTIDFRRKFIKRLQDVLAVYPQARVAPGEGGLELTPSRSHIPMRLVRSKRS